MEALQGKRAALLGLAALAPFLLGATRSSEPWDGRMMPRSAALFESTMLDAQNQARGALGLGAMQWDAALARDATAYAQELAASGEFEHADQDEDDPQGENLWMGTRGAYTYQAMANDWVSEKKWFVNRPTPDFSTTGNWEDVGHYTQIVWRGTSKVGCGFASNSGDDYVVCRYTTAGNVDGEKAV